jgi:hypothetical protein
MPCRCAASGPGSSQALVVPVQHSLSVWCPALLSLVVCVADDALEARGSFNRFQRATRMLMRATATCAGDWRGSCW